MELTLQSVPRFAPGVRFRFDKARDTWALLAPERLFQPDATAVSVLGLVDGTRTVDAITTELANNYQAPHEVILHDVLALLADLAGKGMVRS